MDISFLDNGTQGHAIIAARKMEGYLKDLRLGKYHKDRILESYIPLREWLTKILIELKASKVHWLMQDYAQFGSDMTSLKYLYFLI
jgi:hypothetical protein